MAITINHYDKTFDKTNIKQNKKIFKFSWNRLHYFSIFRAVYAKQKEGSCDVGNEVRGGQHGALKYDKSTISLKRNING